jgi:FXSXX-COOH protein
MDGVHMRDGHHGPSPLIDISGVPLHEMRTMESAALRAVLASCLADDHERVGGFSNSI